MNVPKRGIGDATLKKIIKKNETDQTDLLQTIMDIGGSKSRSFGASIKKNLLAFGSICSTIKEMMTKQVNDIDINIVDIPYGLLIYLFTGGSTKNDTISTRCDPV